ncbi:UvrD-helicase domain-containing protein [Spongorhabdus nitratireducens]
MENTKVAFSDVFFSALTNLPPNIQAKVNQLVLKFQSNPRSTGLNYEKLNALKDKRMRSLRVDNTYRAIVSAPKEGNVFLFLWVDHHDKAYDWASRHKCEVNPNTGTLQLYAASIEDQISPPASSVAATVGKFDDLKDRQLLKLGVPEEQIPLVRQIQEDQAEEQLEKIQLLLPEEAYEGLYLIMAGELYGDILLERETEENKTYDTDNFSEALSRIQSQSRFVVPNSDKELTEMLNAPKEKWRVFLHSSQRKIAFGEKNGAVRVLGGAGTGKTVVAMHRAKWLAQQLQETDQHILFTTFTRNLAVDIQENLNNICTEDELDKIEVVNLDRWVQGFLRKQSYDYQIVFDTSRMEQYWRVALSEKPADIDFPDSFYTEEWQQVIQPQGVTSLAEYKRASRIGRGTRLNREQRVKIWPVFEEYRHQLNRNRQKETDDAYRDATQLLLNQRVKLPYSSIVVDEAQDMGTQAFNLLRAIVPEGKNDLFIVGDAHQRIYGRNRVVLGRCGINIRGRSRKLKINYRTTDEIRKWATALLDGRDIDDLDGGSDDNKLYKSLTHGATPVVELFETSDDQAKFIKQLLDQSEHTKSNTCIVARTNREVNDIQKKLETLGVATLIIKPNEPEREQSDTVKLATVHRVKGLEFDQLIIASVNDGLMPLSFAMSNKGDDISRTDAETEERSLVYVAITRARKAAYVLSYGSQSSFIIR